MQLLCLSPEIYLNTIVYVKVQYFKIECLFHVISFNNKLAYVEVRETVMSVPCK